MAFVETRTIIIQSFIDSNETLYIIRRTGNLLRAIYLKLMTASITTLLNKLQETTKLGSPNIGVWKLELSAFK